MDTWLRGRKILGVVVLVGFVLWLFPHASQLFFSRTKAEIFFYSFIIGGVIIGFFVYKISYYQWIHNATNDNLFYADDELYKVVKIKNPYSWQLVLDLALHDSDKKEFFNIFSNFCRELKHYYESD